MTELTKKELTELVDKLQGEIAAQNEKAVLLEADAKEKAEKAVSLQSKLDYKKTEIEKLKAEPNTTIQGLNKVIDDLKLKLNTLEAEKKAQAVIGAQPPVSVQSNSIVNKQIERIKQLEERNKALDSQVATLLLDNKDLAAKLGKLFKVYAGYLTSINSITETNILVNEYLYKELTSKEAVKDKEVKETI